MLLQNKNILLISPEPWTHLFVSKHHYAIHLGKRRNSVFFLNPPSENKSVEKTEYNNVFSVHYNGFVKGLRFYPSFLQKYFIRKKFNELQKQCGVKFDCVWSFDNSVFFDFSFLPKHVLCISHIVDHSQDFQLERAAATARFCMGVSQLIVNKLSRFNKCTFLMPHGITVSLTDPQPQKLTGRNLIKAVYAGNLDSKLIDRDLLFLLIDKFPQVDFVFFGTGGSAWPKRENVFLAGKVPAEKLEEHLVSADVLLMIYNSEKFPEQLTNSHKILEYLHAGKVIVSSYISDYASHEELLCMAKANEELPKLFSQVISSLPSYNDPQKVNQRRQFARQNTYTKRLLEIENIIQNLNNP